MSRYINCITEKGNSRLSPYNTFSDKILQYNTSSAPVTSTSAWEETRGEVPYNKKGTFFGTEIL